MSNLAPEPEFEQAYNGRPQHLSSQLCHRLTHLLARRACLDLGALVPVHQEARIQEGFDGRLHSRARDSVQSMDVFIATDHEADSFRSFGKPTVER